MSRQATVSVVVCTHGERWLSLQRLIAVLAWQTLPFELVIVLGPASPETRAFVEQLPDDIQRVTCDALNISRARNVGTAASAGELIVFIDDDARPARPDWLEALTAPLHDPRVGAAGGPVYSGETDFFEFRNGATSRSGFQRFGDDGAARAPDGTPWVSRVPGGNCAIRRDVLAQVGGFDEQFAYYLDEADLCVRLDAAGYRVEQVEAASIRHFPAPSAHDRSRRRDRRPIARSDAYFVCRHASGSGLQRLWVAVRSHASKHFVREGAAMYGRGEMSWPALLRFRVDSWRGLASGLWAALTTGPIQASRTGPALRTTARLLERRRALVIDPGQETLGGASTPHTLLTWSAALQRARAELALIVVSGRVSWPEAAGVACLPPAPVEAFPGLETVATPRLGVAANEAVRWIRMIGDLGLLPVLDVLLWPGPADTGALIAAGLGRPVVLIRPGGRMTGYFDGFPPPSSTDVLSPVALVASLLVRSLETSEPDDPLRASALLIAGLCVQEARYDLAWRLGSALRPHFRTADVRAAQLDYHLAHALRALGRTDDARELYEDLRRHGPERGASAAMIGGACFHLACDAQAHRQDAQARRLLRECLDHLPAHGAARRLLENLRGAADSEDGDGSAFLSVTG